MPTQTIYGIGGFDKSKPNDNIIEIIETEVSPQDQARQAALVKLEKLGLTQEEAEAIVGF